MTWNEARDRTIGIVGYAPRNPESANLQICKSANLQNDPFLNRDKFKIHSALPETRKQMDPLDIQ